MIIVVNVGNRLGLVFHHVGVSGQAYVSTVWEFNTVFVEYVPAVTGTKLSGGVSAVKETHSLALGGFEVTSLVLKSWP